MLAKDGYTSSSTLILMAALNEADGIGLTITELSKYLPNPKILVVDGNSDDTTVDVAKSLDADVIFQEGRGKGDAVAAAIRHLSCDLDHNYTYVVMTDADYTYPAEFIPQMIQILDENRKVGMVCGNRFNSHLDVEAMRNVFYVGNRLLAFTHNFFNGVALRDPLTGLRVIRWEILKNWEPKSAGFDIEVELNHRVERQGFGIVEIEIPYRSRVGEKKLKLVHGLEIMKRIVLETTY